MSDSRPADRAVALIPALVAGALAVIYVTGSINAAGALSQDDLPVSSVRLFSLEQLLVRGVSVWTQPDLVFSTAFMLAFGLVAVQAIRSVVRKAADRPFGSAPPRILKWGAAVSLMILASVMLLAPLRIVAVVVPISVLFLGTEFMRALLAPPKPWKAVVRSIFALALFLGANYAIAFRQPLAETELRSGEPGPSGVLITHVDATWFIAVEEGADRVQAIPDTHLRDVRLSYRDNDWVGGDSLFQKLSGT